MKITRKTETGYEVEFRVSDDCIDTYIDGKFQGGFDIDYLDDNVVQIRPDSIEITPQRQGIYTTIIDTILFDDELQDILRDELSICKAEFMSGLRSEKACNFWLKRGYGEEYNEKDHLNGEQERIYIGMF